MSTLAMVRTLFTLVLAVVASAAIPAIASSQAAAPSLSEREKAFADRLKGATLVGRFTVDGRDDQPGLPDRYDLTNVEKVDDARWRFTARIQYGGKDVTMPVVLPLTWIGETPAIHVDNLAIPFLGSFTVHLVFHEDRYAGIWKAGGKTGGVMFGRIERPAQ